MNGRLRSQSRGPCVNWSWECWRGAGQNTHPYSSKVTPAAFMMRSRRPHQYSSARPLSVLSPLALLSKEIRSAFPTALLRHPNQTATLHFHFHDFPLPLLSLCACRPPNDWRGSTQQLQRGSGFDRLTGCAVMSMRQLLSVDTCEGQVRPPVTTVMFKTNRSCSALGCAWPWSAQIPSLERLGGLPPFWRQPWAALSILPDAASWRS